MKKRCILILFAFVALVGAGRANAQILTGSISAEEDLNAGGPRGFATGSSMALGATNIVQSATGSFDGIVGINSFVTSYDLGAFSGLSTTPTTDSSPLLGFPFPSNRFTFILGTLAEDSYNSTTGAAVFTGTGEITDNNGIFLETPADLIVNFTSANDYSFTLQTVPEPTTACLAAAGLLGLWGRRLRRG